MKFFRSKRFKRRIIAGLVLLTVILSFSVSGNGRMLIHLKEDIIYAAQRIQQTQQELNNVQNQINQLENAQEEVAAELNEKAEELSSLLADKEILENELAYVEAAIVQTNEDLEVAKGKEQTSYAAMKLRIQYMYENSTQDSFIDAIMNANSLTDMLNRVEYVSQVYTSDRELFEGYKLHVEEVEDLASSLEANKYELVNLQEIYAHQEKEIEKKMKELKAKSDNYEAQIKAAEKKAKKLAKEIEEQNRILASQSSGGSTQNSAPSTAGGYLTDPSYDPAFRTGISGEQVVNFALQYVGYPYKYGGNSLTNGCDCSGFVNLIFKNFGITVPRQSYAFKTIGQPVAFANLKAGDIVVYPGHVGIYIGNGNIVEAQSTRAGITCTRSVTCSTITAIRRVL